MRAYVSPRAARIRTWRKTDPERRKAIQVVRTETQVRIYVHTAEIKKDTRESGKSIFRLRGRRLIAQV